MNTQPTPIPTPADEIPLICFDADICRLFAISKRTLQRLIRARVFPIATLPSLDNRRRWSREAVRGFLNGGPVLSLRRRA